MKNIGLALLMGLTMVSGSNVQAEECSNEQARKVVYGLLQEFEKGNQITDLYSNLTSRASAQKNGSYTIKMNYKSNKMRKVVAAKISAKNCKLEEYEGSSVWAVDADGNEK